MTSTGEPVPGNSTPPPIEEANPEGWGVAHVDGAVDRTVAEASSTRTTKDQVEAKAKEAQGAFSNLLDQMEKSRETQGDYFVTVGSKTDEGDTRAMMLIKKSQGDNGTFVIMTPDGPKTVDNSYAIGNIYNAVSNPSYNFGESSKYVRGVGEEPDKLDIQILEKGGKEVLSGPSNLKDVDDESEINLAVEKSTVAAESPHKKALELAQKRVDLAHSLLGNISQLPPKE